LSESVEVDETQTKCDPGNLVRNARTYSYEISGDGVYIDEAVDTGKQSHAKLKGYLRNKTEITWRMSTGITSPTHEYGTGYITSLELTGESGSNATFTFTISGTGSISSTDPNA
jgi:predicted secreted protein